MENINFNINKLCLNLICTEVVNKSSKKGPMFLNFYDIWTNVSPCVKYSRKPPAAKLKHKARNFKEILLQIFC